MLLTKQYPNRTGNSFISLRNLSFSNLREWTVDHKNELQSLNALDVTGNYFYLKGLNEFVFLPTCCSIQG